MALVPAESIFRVDNRFPPQDFHGFSELLLSSVDRSEELLADDDMSDDGFQMVGEKKRRLNMEQVRALEKSFEVGNKLEPERKMELARALGLHPRQIAIWFQNRRARWKTKKLERDYDVLKRQLETLKADNDALKSQNKNLQTQLSALKTRESAGFLSDPNKMENDHQGSSWIFNGSCEVNLNKLDTILFYNPHHNHIHQTNENDAVDAFPIASHTHAYCNYMFAAGSFEESQNLWPWAEH